MSSNGEASGISFGVADVEGLGSVHEPRQSPPALQLPR